eukprot:scaffold12220_cov204-Skeletonema_marinoi.AAC.11
MLRHLLNNNNDTIHSKRPLNERERDVHVHSNRQRNLDRHRMRNANTAARKRTRAQQSLDERRSTQDADTAARKRTRAQHRQRYVDRHRMQTLLHESEQEHSNRQRNEMMEGVRIEKHAGGKDQ